MFRTLFIKAVNFLFPTPAFDYSYLMETRPMNASITPLSSGRFALVTPDGQAKTYTRRRDAVRGAKRLGLAVA